MTHSLDLPAATTTELRDMARAATLAAALAFGFGGETWRRQTPSGSGMSARMLIDAGQVIARVVRQRPGLPGIIAGGTPALADQWRAILLSGSALPGDVLTSVADADYCFGIATIEPWYDYQRCELERRR